MHLVCHRHSIQRQSIRFIHYSISAIEKKKNATVLSTCSSISIFTKTTVYNIKSLQHDNVILKADLNLLLHVGLEVRRWNSRPGVAGALSELYQTVRLLQISVGI